MGSREDAEGLLGRLGRILPQYDGRTSHEIEATPGFEGLLHSKSSREIYVHTEAPGWDPVPQYLALYCHAQARCGGGHTTICDGRKFLADLGDRERALMFDVELEFPGAYGKQGKDGEAEWTVRTPMVSRDASGSEVIRFSYTHLTFGDYTPDLGREVSVDRLPLGREGIDLAAHGTRFFTDNHLPVLIPDHALLIWDNRRMFHGRSAYTDRRRHLTRFFVGAQEGADRTGR
ncbi:hypothetical protein RVR_9528 [Actinacidiphila reveromycinica]|uniref:TauD/TfdA-like domain-containing protein n=1 Tax=Actinacidiphila reveromycinica TaxID=659352 RepID=A0A7U3V0C4_9ACTN|nr:hypothetical protein RVR_9528 [Streptomyces sp. SN-593]